MDKKDLAQDKKMIKSAVGKHGQKPPHTEGVQKLTRRYPQFLHLNG